MSGGRSMWYERKTPRKRTASFTVSRACPGASGRTSTATVRGESRTVRAPSPQRPRSMAKGVHYEFLKGGRARARPSRGGRNKLRPSRAFKAGEEFFKEGIPVGGLGVGGGKVFYEVSGIAGEGGGAPVTAQAFAQVTRRDLTQGVEVTRGARVIQEVAAVEEVVLPEKGAFRAYRALDERGDGAVVGREPRDDVACLRPRMHRQHDALRLDDFSGHAFRVPAGCSQITSSGSRRCP